MNKKVDEGEQFVKIYGTFVNLKKLDAIIVAKQLNGNEFECFGIANGTIFKIYIKNHICTDEIDSFLKDDKAFIKINSSYVRKSNLLFYNDSSIAFMSGNLNERFSIKI